MTPRDEEADRDEAMNRLCHSVGHVAEILDVSTSAVRRMIRNKQLDAIYFGASLRVTDLSLQRVAQVGTRRRAARAKSSALSRAKEPRGNT
jgi:hypothetical protein